MMWPRNPKEVHGNVFVDSPFVGTQQPTTIARAPLNEGRFAYPHAEVVLLNATLDNIAPEGWGDADRAAMFDFGSSEHRFFIRDFFAFCKEVLFVTKLKSNACKYYGF